MDGIPGSDHDGVHFNISIDCRSDHKKPHRRLFSFKKADFNAFRDMLSIIPWDCCFLEGGIEDAWTKLKDLFMTAANQCIPTFTLKQRRSKSWISSEVLSLVRKKRRAYRTVKHSQNPKHQQQYKSLCNTVRNLTRRDRLHHVNQITKEIHHDQKPFWRWLKNTKGGHHSIPDIHHQGNTLSTCDRL